MLGFLFLFHETLHFCLDAGHFLLVVDFQIVVDEGDVFAWRQGPAIGFDFLYAYAAVELRHLVAAAVGAFGLPGVVDVRGFLDLGGGEDHFLFVFPFYRVLCPGAEIHEEDFMGPVSQMSPMVGAALFILVQDPQGDADVGGDEEFPGQHDDGFHFVILDELLADGHGVGVVQGAIGQEESRHAGLLFQVGEHVEDPGIVGVALRRGLVARPPGVVGQVAGVPAFQVEWGIRHDVVEVEAFVEVVCEGGVVRVPQVVADAPEGQIHLRQAVGGGFFFLAVYVDAVDVALLGFHQRGALDEHAAAAAAGVVEGAVVGFDHGGDELHRVMGCIEV